MQRTARLLLAAVAVSLLSMLLGTSSAAAKVHSFQAATEYRGILTFRIQGLDAQRIRSAKVLAPDKRVLKVDRRKIQRAAKRGILRIKVSQRQLRTKSRKGGTFVARAARHRPWHKLRVVTAPETAVPAPGVGKATTSDIGVPILSDADAAARVARSGFEPRPGNAQANQRVPTATELRFFGTYSPNWGPCAEAFKPYITGNFTGTTDEIIQWAAHKWGIAEDIVRSVAVKESYWNQDARGDWDSAIQDYQSYGLTQVRRNSRGESGPTWDGTFPLSRDSTAFNLDFWGASVRQYYEGCSTWLNDVSGNGASYAAGDIWGSVGAWYSGRWWNGDAQWYVGDVKNNLANRFWEQPGF